ncbi:GGDEF domain-containing protein [Vogesella sp. DC21W]|uniref:diguanylate cyclase n=1 Tax=Vogesella aquatica TaxID=2984206 RepID=A0ABT5IZT5_9NEIS|nr:GGDEF domain-containing protein [Vogesella aquatica]MDC7718078.1 GGDEF domain-containing protein [Vogesella aquatica]
MFDIHILPIALTIILVGWSSWRFAAGQTELLRERRIWLQGCLCIACGLVLEAQPIVHWRWLSVLSMGLLLGGYQQLALVLSRLQQQRAHYLPGVLLLLLTGLLNTPWLPQAWADSWNAAVLALVYGRLSWLHWQIERAIRQGYPILTTLYGLGTVAFVARLALGLPGGQDQALLDLVEPLLYLFASTATIYGSFGFLMVILRRRTQHLVRETLQDSLTGALNRRGLDETMLQLRQSVPPFRHVAIAMLDVDHFKQVNDRYGHAAGDEVLRQLVRFFCQSLREQDVFARYGGEEFCLLLPGASLADAQRKLDSLREQFAALAIPAGEGVLHCTFSAGLVCWDNAEVNPDKLLHQADDLLYQAKRAGRNCIAVAAEPNHQGY